jgi:SH3-like domain-containing protein
VVEAATAPAPPAPPAKAAAQTTTSKAATLTIAAQRAKLLVPGGTIYVRRAGSVLRAAQKTSGAPLAKLAKGAAVIVVAAEGPWTQVKSGDATGWMRTSVLGPKP